MIRDEGNTKLFKPMSITPMIYVFMYVSTQSLWTYKITRISIFVSFVKIREDTIYFLGRYHHIHIQNYENKINDYERDNTFCIVCNT